MNLNLKLTQRVSETLEAFRAWLPTAPQEFRRLVEGIREDPRAAVRSPAFRITVLAVSGVVLAFIVYGLGEWIAPSRHMGEPAELVPFKVRCVNPQCQWSQQHHTLSMDRDFDDWPAECPQCEQERLYPFSRCHNTQCRKWVVPNIQPDGSWRCPKCGSPL